MEDIVSISNTNEIDPQEISLDQLGEIAGGVADTPEHRQKLERERQLRERQKRENRRRDHSGDARPV